MSKYTTSELDLSIYTLSDKFINDLERLRTYSGYSYDEPEFITMVRGYLGDDFYESYREWVEEAIDD